jgi:DNA mismatch repair protein PMS2
MQIPSSITHRHYHRTILNVSYPDVRFKNQGLDLIEVADNGSGIAPDNYSSVALKHHTSKLSSYSDIATLETFGFRGEALASLCALSTVTITTCQQGEAPKGTKLSFETSGKLSGTAVVAASKGTTVSVERLFHNLPVRRRELERNIKREWNKVIAKKVPWRSFGFLVCSVHC